ncbi:beta-ketoacyl-ACP synthase [Rodentibacter heidelbergensis]|uniref:Beta-ketoacyl-[acyl-carrier-protein] synthase II n=1 Tax=Rodentibacter heidelbergensis TaxID=1908258 RepID=A0A1V3I9H8_9PAST|nr:beta-ketoacyl-ACP synthase [Rodentibacter heidelbergensis]OOF36762.1 beta-ketoacyl-[acyl-carrier-protein] synthase II [Rodentibacter heidelbergensis]
MTALYLSRPAILSSLGEGICHHIKSLLEEVDSPLSLSDHLFQSENLEGPAYMLGAIKSDLCPFSVDLPEVHRSRNNQVLWHCLQQIESLIESAINQFGETRIAVVIGSSTTGVDENIPVFKYESEHPNDWSGATFKQQQQYFSAPADFIAHQYGLSGLVYGISTACTSGAKALITAARLLKAQLCDAVICGGVDTLSLLTVKGFDSLSVLSNQRTNPFSAYREGINIGEGAAVFMMSREPLDDSTIQLLGYGASSDAYHMSSPHPEGEGAVAAFNGALASAKVAPHEIGWINLHGTGTLHNDQMESLAVSSVFGHQTPCTSTKPYTGHTLGAAGAIEAAILWGMINRSLNPNGRLPAQLWDEQRDPNLPPIALTDSYSYWPNSKRVGASSSFAFGGNNTVLILGESDD